VAAPLASIADLAALLGTTIAPNDPAASLALAAASDAIRRLSGQTISYVQGDVYTPAGDVMNGSRRPRYTLAGANTAQGFDLAVPLPQRPVLAVSAVNGLVPGVSFRLSGSDLLLASFGYWSVPLTITYDHGYQVIPDDLRGATATAAARLLDNPQELASESIGGYSKTYSGRITRGTAAPYGPLSAAEAVVARAYRRTATTTPLVLSL